MRRLTGLAIRITASVLLLLTISAWAVSRFQHVTIVAQWVYLEVSPLGLVVIGHDWDEMSVSIKERNAKLDETYALPFDYPRQSEPYEFACWFPGGWVSKYYVGYQLVIEHVALIGYAAVLNIVVYGIWWRRRRRTASDD